VDPSHVDHRVEGAEAGHRRIDGTAGLGLVGHVGAERKHARTGYLAGAGHRLGRVPVDVDERHRGAFLREELTRDQADAAAATCDERDAVRERPHHA
jgi:hypothetical protein